MVLYWCFQEKTQLKPKNERNQTMNNTNTAELTLAIRAFIEAKKLEKAAKAEAAKRQAVILAALGGDEKTEFCGTDGVTYILTPTYGKTRSVISKELIEAKFNIVIGEDCYTVSKPWDELRTTAM